MRSFLPSSLTVPLLALGLCGSSCTCSPPTAVPITMKVINRTQAPLYLDATRDKLGLTVQREIGGQRFGFDDLACECTYCSSVCSVGCSCPDAGVALVQRVQPGATAQRPWSGVVQVAGNTTCGTSGCVNQENAPLDETFSLQLCYSTQKPANVFDDAGVGPGAIVASAQTCITKEFKLQDGVVEIGPTPGASCTSSADCKGVDELCFDGTCTAGCPGNDFPTGTDYVLYVARPDTMGFFTQSAGDAGTRFTGTGTLTSVVYAGSSLELSLSRPGAGAELLTGKVTVVLPPALGPPLMSGTAVSVLVVDDGKSRPNRALTLRSATTGGLLFAADMAQRAPLLTSADTAPFTLTSTETPIGCTQTDCGRFLYFQRQVSTATATTLLDPGSPVTIPQADGSYTFLSISDGKYASTTCDVSDIRPWVMWKQ